MPCHLAKETLRFVAVEPPGHTTAVAGPCRGLLPRRCKAVRFGVLLGLYERSLSWLGALVGSQGRQPGGDGGGGVGGGALPPTARLPADGRALMRLLRLLQMALLAYKLLTALRISHKGYILDGFPRNLRAAKWLLTKEKPMTEEELEDFQKDRQEGQAEAEATSKGGKRKDKGGKGGDKGGKGGKVRPACALLLIDPVHLPRSDNSVPAPLTGTFSTQAAPDEDVPEDKPRTPALEVLPNFAITLHLPAGIAEKRTAALFEAEQQELQKLIEEGKVASLLCSNRASAACLELSDCRIRPEEFLLADFPCPTPPGRPEEARAALPPRAQGLPAEAGGLAGAASSGRAAPAADEGRDQGRA